MSTMNVSLPDQMKQWIDGKIKEGGYHNVSEYVRTLIRKDQAEHEKRLAFRAAIDHGRTSGVEKRDFKSVIKTAKSKAKRAN
jgi:antitoxin ParD1/3/4